MQEGQELEGPKLPIPNGEYCNSGTPSKDWVWDQLDEENGNGIELYPGGQVVAIVIIQ